MKIWDGSDDLSAVKKYLNRAKISSRHEFLPIASISQQQASNSIMTLENKTRLPTTSLSSHKPNIFHFPLQSEEGSAGPRRTSNSVEMCNSAQSGEAD